MRMLIGNIERRSMRSRNQNGSPAAGGWMSASAMSAMGRPERSDAHAKRERSVECVTVEDRDRVPPDQIRGRRQTMRGAQHQLVGGTERDAGTYALPRACVEELGRGQLVVQGLGERHRDLRGRRLEPRARWWVGALKFRMRDGCRRRRHQGGQAQRNSAYQPGPQADRHNPRASPARVGAATEGPGHCRSAPALRRRAPLR